MHNELEPLATHLWFERISLIEEGRLGNIENALRHAMHLTQLCPYEFRSHVAGTIDEEEYEADLANGNFEAAARALVSSLDFNLAADANAHGIEATIAGDQFANSLSRAGDTIASATLKAWSAYLLQLRFNNEYQMPGEDHSASNTI